MDKRKAEAMAAHRKYVRAFDGAMPERMLWHLRRAFGATSPFWSQHGYHREGCGFFSYVHSLRVDAQGAFVGGGGVRGGAGGVGFESTMDAVVRRVWRVAAAAFPAAKEATRAEWWAHCRPHSSGHQMHFDSDDEGSGGFVKHPICSAVVYVTGGVGGPTLVTNQTDRSKQLATRGWLVGPKEGRVAVFDGDMLHGVIPGRGACPPLPPSAAAAAAGFSASSGDAWRITLMVAFWRTVKVRGAGGGSGLSGSFPKGSSRPFPNPKTFASDPSCPPGVTWPTLFNPMELSLDDDDEKKTKVKKTREKGKRGGGGGGGGSDGDDVDDDAWVGREAAAVEVGAVWEDVDFEKNAKCLPSLSIARIKSLPPYSVCFQGF